MAKPHKGRDSQLFVYRRLGDDELERYRRQGFLLYGQALTDEGLKRVRGECQQAWQAEKQGFDPEKSWLQNALLVNIHHRSQVVRDFYFCGPMVDVAEQVIGPNIKAATSQLTFKMRGNTMPFAWHQDNSYGELDPYNAISCLTALDDADPDNGCLWVVPGSHLAGQLQAGHRTDDIQASREVRLEVDESRAEPVPMKAGQSLFFHCHLLHKSEGNRSKDRDRRLLFLRYADADAVEVYNNRAPRLGRLLRGTTRFEQVKRFEADLA